METDKIIEAVLSGTVWTLCRQCRDVVMREDYEPRAGMCKCCVSEAFAEAPEFFGRRGLVATAEEEDHND